MLHLADPPPSGIGAGLLRSYLLRPNHLVIGSVRDASSPSYSNLENLPTGANSCLHLVSLESTVESDAASAVASSQQALGIDHIDIVIANAGVNPPVVAPELTKAEDMLSTYKVNAVGPMWLYQATRELLAKAQKPIWITISSSAGSVTKLEEFGITKLLAYGASKTAVNWLTV
jgi:NAD(P)-dependent dehydrogenase (short-subunit alcohol dehydrogenase family)